MKLKPKIMLGILGAMIALVAPTVAARTIRNYDLTLPRFGATTTSDIKKTNATFGVNNNISIGGGKTLNTAIRLSRTNGDITPMLAITPGSRITFSYRGGGDNYIGSNTRLALAAQFGNIVRINTRGTWSPDSR